MEGLSGSSASDQIGRTSICAGDPAASTSTVDRIAHDRVTDMLQVNPKLVGSAGLELQPEQVDALEPCHHRGLGPGRPALGRDRHSFPVGRVAGDGCVNAKRRRIEVTPGKCGVSPAHPARSDCRAQPPVRLIGLCDQHQA